MPVEAATEPSALIGACPWDALRLATGAPNLDWCEAEQCGWVVEPANTYSNLAYLVVGAVLLARQRSAPPAHPLVRWLPASILLVGIASFAYHASTTYLLQVGDFLAMYAVLGAMLVINGERLGVVEGRRRLGTYGAVVLALMAALLVMRAFDVKYQLSIALGVLLVLVTEAIAARRARAPGYGALTVGTLLLVAGAAFSAADLSGAFCDPGEVVWQGHAIWHVLSAVALGFAYHHYAALGPLGAGDAE